MLYGAHLSSAGGIHKAVERATERRCDAIQVFTQSPRMWRPSTHADETLASFREARAKAALGAVVCHAIYLVNLASPDDDVYEKSRATMRATVDTACAIEAEGVVFHVGSHLGSGFDAALDRIAAALRELLEHCADRTWLLMENTAGAGGTIGRSVIELETIFDALDGHPRLGVCIDSCHWWASGIDVTEAVALDEAVRDLDSRIGLDRLRCLHVNDSQAPLASNRDRHENVGKGLIGTGLATFLAHPAFQGLPAILETPGPDGHGPDAAELRRLRQLHKRGVEAEMRRSGAHGSSGGARTSP